MLKPSVTRRQISPYKFLRIKNSSHSKRVRVFLSLEERAITEVLEAYVCGGHLYAYHGATVPQKGYAKRKTWVYRTFYFRYELNEAVYLAGYVV